YMSPEQCAADPHDIDVRSDVYALGVLLYELLAGRLPYDVRHKPMHECTRVIQEEQPTRLSTADHTLRGDVETIVFKALEKDRDRRYQSAIELAQDIRRYLAGEAIVARPPSITYQLRVFARRNRALFVGAAAVFAVLVAGIIVSTALYVRAEHAHTQAAVERDRAQAMNEFFKDMLQTVDPTADFGRPGGRGVTDLTAADMLQAAARTIEQRFGDDPDLEAEVRGALGAAFVDIGENELAEVHYARALGLCRRIWGDDHEQTLEMKMGYGQATRQIPYLREAYEGLRRLYGAHHRQTLVAAERLARRLTWEDQLDEAESVLTAALNMEPSPDQATERERAELFGTLAFAKIRQGDLAAFEANARKEYEIVMRVHDPDSLAAAGAHLRLAYALLIRGQHPEAVAEAREVMPRYRRHLGTGHPGTVFMATIVAEVFIGAGEFDEAEQVLRESIEAQRRRLGLAAEDHPYTLRAMADLVQVHAASGKRSEAGRYAEKCLRGALRVGDDADALNSASWAAVKSPGWEPHLYELALKAAEKACELSRSSSNLNTLGLAQYRAGRYEDALRTLRRVDARVIQASGSRLAWDVAFLAMSLFQLGRVDEAHDELNALQEIVAEGPWQGLTESNDFLQEAEALIQGAPAHGRPGERQVLPRDPNASTPPPQAVPGEETP
ncbi:MAG: tetratricopeptide repeat protein, partial [Phycisphaerales bacterium]